MEGNFPIANRAAQLEQFVYTATHLCGCMPIQALPKGSQALQKSPPRDADMVNRIGIDGARAEGLGEYFQTLQGLLASEVFHRFTRTARGLP